jgi:hypothetical protein
MPSSSRNSRRPHRRPPAGWAGTSWFRLAVLAVAAVLTACPCPGGSLPSDRMASAERGPAGPSPSDRPSAGAADPSASESGGEETGTDGEQESGGAGAVKLGVSRTRRSARPRRSAGWSVECFAFAPPSATPAGRGGSGSGSRFASAGLSFGRGLRDHNGLGGHLRC